MKAVDQPDPIGAESGPTQQGVCGNFGLIGVFSVKVQREDPCVHGGAFLSVL
jgi:hypothetical protein